MKQKISSIFASLLLFDTIADCSAGAPSTKTSYIGGENAYAVALEAAGVDAGSASMTGTQLSEQDGIPYYEVEFTVAGTEYNYSIDAVTGVVIESKTDDSLVADASSGSVANPAADDVTDYDTVSIGNAGENETKHVDTPSVNATAANTPKASAEITLEQAKQIALEHAGKTNVTFVKAQKDFDDGQWVYEIEFITQSGNSYQEYDYNISVSTGKILSYDQDAEGYAPPKQDSATKTEEEVRNIALAKVPGAKKSDCFLSLDQDDGRLVYEGKIVYNQMQYEFEIDAHSGTILDWEAESIYD